VSESPETPLPPPGVLKRAAAGAWHVPAGLVFLLRRPRLWLLALLPAALAVAFVALGFVAGLFAARSVDAALAPAPESLPEWLGLTLTVFLWIGTVAAGMIVGFGAALALASPLLERLSRRVETLVRGQAVGAATGVRWELAQALRAAGYFIVAAPGVFLLGLVPVLGPGLAALWGAHALAFQETDGTLARRGLDFRARQAWHRRWRPESLGFGLAGLVTLIVPLANLLLAPAVAVGATRLVLELEGLPTAPPA
jgi:CysZ protein